MSAALNVMGLLASLDPAAPVIEPSAAATSGTAEFVIFWIMAPLALGTALSVVLLRNSVHAALLLVVNFFTLAVLYATLEAQFLAVVQIIVYAGAIMVLFLFVLMLLGGGDEQRFGERLRGQKAAAVLLGVTLFAALTIGVAGPYLGRDSACSGATGTEAADARPCAGLAAANAEREGNVAGIGALLFTDYVWPFEVTSVLLVIAALGAMVLGRKTEQQEDLVDVPRREDDDEMEELPHQTELEVARERSHEEVGG